MKKPLTRTTLTTTCEKCGAFYTATKESRSRWTECLKCRIPLAWPDRQPPPQKKD